MTQTVSTDELCGFCGVDVRVGTAFCYNCGKPVNSGSSGSPIDEATTTDVAADENAPIPKPGTTADDALADLADRLDRDRDETERLAKAAAERKRSRTERQKRSVEVWASPENESPLRAALIAVLMLFATIVFVLLAVWIK